MPKWNAVKERKTPSARNARDTCANVVAALAESARSQSTLSGVGPGKTPSLAEVHYTVAEVAAMRRVVPKTVLNWIDRGELHAWRKGRIVRIPHSALIAFDKKQMNSTRSRRPGKSVS